MAAHPPPRVEYSRRAWARGRVGDGGTGVLPGIRTEPTKPRLRLGIREEGATDDPGGITAIAPEARMPVCSFQQRKQGRCSLLPLPPLFVQHCRPGSDARPEVNSSRHFGNTVISTGGPTSSVRGGEIALRVPKTTSNGHIPSKPALKPKRRERSTLQPHFYPYFYRLRPFVVHFSHGVGRVLSLVLHLKRRCRDPSRAE